MDNHILILINVIYVPDLVKDIWWFDKSIKRIQSYKLQIEKKIQWLKLQIL